jgi:2,4-dienoyl-CoA reductase-like NADH-dependent reductase (Old Yellow Enzyme family)
MSRTLFDPITLRDLTVRNRVWVPPMCQYMVERTDGVVTPWHLMHYGSFARGGAGAVIVEASGVTPGGRISPQDLGLWNGQQRDALRPVVDLVHSLGAAIGIQLAHAGRKASTYSEWGNGAPGSSLSREDGAWETIAPSALAFGDLATPRALDEAGIDDVVQAFVDAARRAVEAGMDMIEIHGAHGYLIHEFLSPLSNHRSDQYGGSLENRARLLMRIVDGIRAEVPEGMPVLVRLSATDWVEDGLHVEDTARIAAWLREHGVDMVDISSGGNSPAAQIPVGPGYQTPLATAVKQGAGIPVSAVGMIDEPWQAEQITATGLADVVRVGREFLRDPSFAIRAALALNVQDAPIPAPYRRAYRQRTPRS